ncbi:SDR family oxidoreductase [Polycyclovorans algicola]|uniref:SDR family oxidoreductase n=1 Tax=Polycyclovorans algicola TaxID=616992 RepID=UPI0004A7559A|nr:SDR family oxidoreductase [Polycyclovorans algicola]
MGRVQDKVCIITGGASGVGKEDALLMAREGARVVITDVSVDAGEALAKQIGDQAMFIQHDIASEDGWKNVIAKTTEHFGGVDVLVNNAAILKQATIEETTLELWEQVQKVNSTGYFLGCHYGYMAMKARGGGSIVNMSSMAGIGGVSSFCAYSASKAAVAGLTRSIAAHSRFQHLPIRCNSIHPDGIKTPMVFNLPRDPNKPSTVRDGNDAKRLMARFCEPTDIANLVLFLASDESKFINGAEMRIDNGYLMWAD